MNNVSYIERSLCPYGYLDLKAVCEVGDEVNLDENELCEIIEEASEQL